MIMWLAIKLNPQTTDIKLFLKKKIIITEKYILIIVRFYLFHYDLNYKNNAYQLEH
jgi:hypothetical protein